MAAPKGRYHPIMKRMSHIRVVLKTAKPKKEEVKKAEVKNIEEPKIVEAKKVTKKGNK